MAIDMFDTRVMTQALDKMDVVRPKTFLRDTFFKNIRVFDTKKVDVDVRKGKRKIAALVSRRSQANVVGDPGFETNSYEPPYTAELMEMDFETLLKRAFGENIYSPMTPQERVAQKLREQMLILDERVTRLEEYMAMEALVNGKVTVLNGDELDFQRNSDHTVTLTSGARWDQSTGVPFSDARDWRALLVKNSGFAPAISIFGGDAFEAFLGNTQTQALLDKLKVNLGAIEQENLPNGVTYYGTLPDFGKIYTYDEYYHNGSTDVALIPAKKVIMASPNARMDRLYGALALANQDTKQMEVYAVQRLVDKFINTNPDMSFLRMQAAPLLVPTDVDSVLVAQVIS